MRVDEKQPHSPNTGIFPEELTRALQRAHLELYANTSHYPHWEHADRFAGDVIRFVYS